MALHIEYENLNTYLTEINKQISNIEIILSEKFTVTSLKGETLPALEAMLNNLKEGLKAIEEPLLKMHESVENVRQKYIAKEQSIQSGLGGSANGSSNLHREGSGNNYTV